MDEIETTKQEIDQLFKKWERLLEDRYIPQPVVEVQEVPKYTATQKKRISAAEYLKRLQKKTEVPKPQTPVEQKKKRGGKAFKRRKLIAEAYRKLHLTGNKTEKSEILREIDAIRKTRYQK